MRRVAQRKPFLLRLDPATHAALQRWADAELRSLNAQIEFLLRRALIDRGRLAGTILFYKAGHTLDVQMVRVLYEKDLLVEM